MIDLSRDSDEEGAGGAGVAAGGVAAGGVAAGGAGVAEGGAGVAEGGLPIDAAAFAARAAVARVAYDLACARNTAIKPGPFMPYENQADAYPAGSAMGQSWWPLSSGFTASERVKVEQLCDLFLRSRPLKFSNSETFLLKRGLIEVELFGLPRETASQKRQYERRLELPVKELQTYFSNGRNSGDLRDRLLASMLEKDAQICEDFCGIITRKLPDLEQEVRRLAEVPAGVNLNCFVSILTVLPGAMPQLWHHDLTGTPQQQALYLNASLGVTDDPLGGTTEFAVHQQNMDSTNTENNMLVISEIHHGNKVWNGRSVHRGGEAFAQRFSVFIVFDSGRRDENSPRNGKWLY